MGAAELWEVRKPETKYERRQPEKTALVVRCIRGNPSLPVQIWSKLLRYFGHSRPLAHGYWEARPIL